MSGTETAKSAARAAAEWWAKQVGAPLFRNVDSSSGPDELLRGGMAGAMQHMLADLHPATESAGTAFADDLEKRIGDRLKRSNWVSLSVDYAPDGTLADAAQATGVNGSRFPWKTHMSVTNDYVTASLGYRAPSALIWQHPDWDRPACQTTAYDERTNTFGDEWCTLPKFHDGEHGNWQPDPRRCRGCGLTEGGHYNRTDKGDYHSFEVAS